MALLYTLLACILGIVNSQFQCNVPFTPVGDSRLDRARAERERDVSPEAEAFFQTNGVSSASYLRSMVTTRDDGFRSSPSGTQEFQLIGVNQIANFVPSTITGRTGDEIVMNFMDGTKSFTRAPLPTVVTDAAGTALARSPVAASLTFDNCVSSTNGLGTQTNGPNQWSMVCPTTAGSIARISGTDYTTTAALECIAVKGGETVSVAAGVGVWYCSLYELSQATTPRKIIKIFNHIGTDSFRGKDDHLCLASKNCFLWKTNVRETRTPVTSDGIHGNLLTRASVDDLMNSKIIQCSYSDTFNLTTTEKVLAEKIKVLETKEPVYPTAAPVDYSRVLSIVEHAISNRTSTIINITNPNGTSLIQAALLEAEAKVTKLVNEKFEGLLGQLREKEAQFGTLGIIGLVALVIGGVALVFTLATFFWKCHSHLVNNGVVTGTGCLCP